MSEPDIPASSPLFRLRGEIVASARDEQGEISVIDSKMYRILSFDRMFEQSKMQRNAPNLPIHNYIRAMLMVLAFTPGEQVLILGLGGGCLARALYARGQPQTMDVVELRPAVLEIAQHWFSLPADPAIRYLTDNARHFVAAAEPQQYDLILSDLYTADTMSPLQLQENFLADCSAALSPDGWLVMNYSSLPDTHSPVLQTLRAYFATLLYCTAPSGNIVIYAGKAPCNTPLHTLQQQTKKVGNSINCDVSMLAQKLTWIPVA